MASQGMRVDATTALEDRPVSTEPTGHDLLRCRRRLCFGRQSRLSVRIDASHSHPGRRPRIQRHSRPRRLPSRPPCPTTRLEGL
mmetsp:Transcript_3907/g.10022  ORF Transcript_3907/g.10022 Transcript_3907/m.10022 type:complete len:84 (+) Transcript_3907:256-507(+)